MVCAAGPAQSGQGRFPRSGIDAFNGEINGDVVSVYRYGCGLCRRDAASIRSGHRLRA